jgi:5-methylcytosine-specific restriction endonuclease McrA
VPKRRHPLDKRGTAAWQRLRLQVLREEPRCWLRLPGCTGASTTADHVIPVSERPDLALVRSNVRGACAHCNYSRGARELVPTSRAAALDWFDV